VLKDKEDKVVFANIGCVIEKFHKSYVMPPRKYIGFMEKPEDIIFSPKNCFRRNTLARRNVIKIAYDPSSMSM
jgi:hypothetical protein